jgi:hypothetical protein
MAKRMQWLRVRGERIVDEEGRTFYPRGMCLGGWLNTENFINGYPFADHVFLRVLGEVIGEGLARDYAESQREHSFTQADADFLAECGDTAVRIPFNYRLIESDEKPGVYSREGAAWLDRGIAALKKAGIYSILDLHAAPGWQNTDWHCDNPADVPHLWRNRDYRDRLVGLWRFLADRYKNEPAVAGYEIMNEPTAPNVEFLNDVHAEAASAIRKIDKRHMLFFEGNWWGTDFKGFRLPVGNAVATCHCYFPISHRAVVYPNRDHNVKTMVERYANRLAFARRARVPMWCGEWGVLHAKDHAPTKAIFEGKMKALDDQMSYFESIGHGWGMWTYKDIGVMGLVQLDPRSSLAKRTARVRRWKRELGADSWTGGSPLFSRVAGGAIRTLERRFPGSSRRKGRDRLSAQIRRKLGDAIGIALLRPYAEQFEGMSARQIDSMMKSWRLENCRVVRPLAALMKRHSQQ